MVATMRPHPLAFNALHAVLITLLAALAFAATQAASAQAHHRACHQKLPCSSPGDTSAPTVSWKTPAQDATVSGVVWETANSGISGPCEVTATDNVGVAKVIFHVDGTQLNTENVAPYNCKLDTTTIADGSHTLKAVAYDAAGNTATALRTITVKNAVDPEPAPGDTTAPSVSWKSPAADATVSGLLWETANSGSSGPCEASATDNVGISKVVFHVDGTQLNTEDVSPYNCKLDTTTIADGSHTLKAVAYDAAGNTTTALRTIAIKNTPDPEPVPEPEPAPGDTNAPTVTWVQPAEGATVSGFMWETDNSGASGPCETSASDDVGVTKVVYYVDGALLHQENYAPWNCKFDTTAFANGTHTLKAVAYDAAGNTASSQRTVNVQNIAPPPSAGKTLVFQDDFDGPAVNTTNWSPYYSPGHAGNGLRRPSAFSQANGLLEVTATWDGMNITSGGMKHRKDYLYGSFEFRVRTEQDLTGQLSGVVLTWPLSNKKVPDGENDIYETGHSTSRNPFYTYIHYSLDGTTDRQYRFTHNADATQWHIMRMDWTKDSIKIYRDGVLSHTLTDLAAIPDNPHHLCIQLDAFGNRALPGPVKMYVDWVKVYQ